MELYTIPKFIISLETSIDRRDQLASVNEIIINDKTFQYFNAINGHNLDIDTLSPTIYDHNVVPRYSHGAIGCALSHLALWDKCIELNKPIVIFEDDIILSNNFNIHLDTVLKMLPVDFDILVLTYNFDSILSYNITPHQKCNTIFEKTKLKQKDIDNFKCFNIHPTIAKLNHCFGTAAYIISPKGAMLLKQQCFPLTNKVCKVPMIQNFICFSIDSILNTIYSKINAFVCLQPFVITRHECENYTSTI